jgi:hypothetical protein
MAGDVLKNRVATWMCMYVAATKVITPKTAKYEHTNTL